MPRGRPRKINPQPSASSPEIVSEQPPDQPTQSEISQILQSYMSEGSSSEEEEKTEEEVSKAGPAGRLPPDASLPEQPKTRRTNPMTEARSAQLAIAREKALAVRRERYRLRREEEIERTASRMIEKMMAKTMNDITK